MIFCRPILGNFTQVTVLEITATSTTKNFIFRNASNDVVTQFDWEFTNTGSIELTVTSGSGTDEVQAALAMEGKRLTLTEEGEGEEDDRVAVFDIRDDVAAITSYTLQIDGDNQTITTTITFRNEAMQTIEEEYTIVENMLRLTQDGEDPVEVPATLTNSNNTLTLTFPSEDDAADSCSGTGVFEQ